MTPREMLRSTDPTEAVHIGIEDMAATGSALPSRGGRWTREAVAIDVLSLTVALLAAHVLMSGWVRPSRSFLMTLAIGPVVWIGVFRAFALYGWGVLSRFSTWHGLKSMISATSVGVLVVVVAGAWWDQPLVGTALGWLVFLVVAFELLGRSLLRRSIEQHTARDPMRTLVVGTGQEAAELARRLASAGGWFDPLGSIEVSKGSGRWSEGDGLPIVGHIDELEEAIRRNRAEWVVVASTAISTTDFLQISRACRRADAQLRLSTNLSAAFTSRLSFETAKDLTLVAFSPGRLTRAQATLKRGFDTVLASIGLLLLLPLLAVITVAIKLTSAGPVLFRQERITKDGRVFTMLKFRTMDADPQHAPDGKVIDLTRPFFKLEDDPRLTTVGRFLRSFSLDELPQLWNVIRGDMSLVGPRPLPSEQVGAHESFLSPRHEVRGGLTGLWQVSGRSDLDSEEALRLDRTYIEHWSIGLDLYILAKTFGAVLMRRGAM